MKKLITGAIAAAGVAALSSTAFAEGRLYEFPSTPVELDIIGAGGIVDVSEFDLETGVYYQLVLTSDGAAEVEFSSPDLFNNSWVNQINIDDAEIKMWGDTFKAIEVGEEGPNTVSVTFLIIRPGEYAFYLNGEEAGMFHVR